jgi:hypothetical protein
MDYKTGRSLIKSVRKTGRKGKSATTSYHFRKTRNTQHLPHKNRNKRSTLSEVNLINST